MPISPTQAERSAALARLRAHVADPDSPPPSHADLQVLLNPNAQAVALAAENEALRGRVAELEAAKDRRIADLVDKVRALPVERSRDIPAFEGPSVQCPRCEGSLYFGFPMPFPGPAPGTAKCLQCLWEGKAMLVDDGVNVVIVPDPPQHLPCPFCGGKATIHSAIDASVAPKVERWNAVALCRFCGATGPSATGYTHAEGIEAAWTGWDRRDGGAR